MVLRQRRDQKNASRNSTIAIARHMGRFIAPVMQELSVRDRLSPETTAHLHRQVQEPNLAERAASVNI